MRLSQILSLVPFTLAAIAGTTHQAMIRYPDVPPGARPRAFASDAVGNLFIVSTIVESSARPQIHVLKTDSQGNTLATISFGGSTRGAGLADSIAGAAVDPMGNLVIAGTTYSPDFPLASPLITRAEGRTAFLVKIDSQLKNILFSTRLGGTQGGTSAGALAVDKAGNIYATGSTSDTDFPVTSDAFSKTASTEHSVSHGCVRVSDRDQC